MKTIKLNLKNILKPKFKTLAKSNMSKRKTIRKYLKIICKATKKQNLITFTFEKNKKQLHVFEKHLKTFDKNLIVII